MDEISSSPSPPPPPPPPPTTTSSTSAAAAAIATGSKKKREMTALSRIKRDCLSFTVSLQEGFRYVKATFNGKAKKMTARNEQEATEADLQASKMQVEAADAAEDSKTRLSKSM